MDNTLKTVTNVDLDTTDSEKVSVATYKNTGNVVGSLGYYIKKNLSAHNKKYNDCMSKIIDGNNSVLYSNDINMRDDFDDFDASDFITDNFINEK